MFFDVVSGQIHPKILLKVVQNHTYPESILILPEAGRLLDSYAL
jgi:hypothetical protein